MAKVLVYAELNQAKLVPTTLELMAKARELGDVEAVALGAGAKAAAATLGKHGAKVVHVSEDAAFDDYLAEPATDALAALHKQAAPDLILFAFVLIFLAVGIALARYLRHPYSEVPQWTR